MGRRDHHRASSSRRPLDPALIASAHAGRERACKSAFDMRSRPADGMAHRAGIAVRLQGLASGLRAPLPPDRGLAARRIGRRREGYQSMPVVPRYGCARHGPDPKKGRRPRPGPRCPQFEVHSAHRDVGPASAKRRAPLIFGVTPIRISSIHPKRSATLPVSLEVSASSYSAIGDR